MHSLPFRRRFTLIVACGLPLAPACSQSVSAGSKTTPGDDQAISTEITHEACDEKASGALKTDVNNDGRADITRVMKDSRELCRILDLNFDGRVDNFVYFDAAGTLRRRESDFDRDGVIDEIGSYKNGKLASKHRETNLDGKLDTWDRYVDEVLTERLRDTNSDGNVDQWWTFPDPTKPDCPIVARDEDGDGKPDSRHDPCKEHEAEAAEGAQPWEKSKGAESAADAAAPADAGTRDASPDKTKTSNKDGGS